MWITAEDIDEMTAHHPPTSPAVVFAHETVRRVTREAMHALNEILPECPLKTQALTAVRDAMLYGNTAIATVGNRNPLWQQAVAALMAEA